MQSEGKCRQIDLGAEAICRDRAAPSLAAS